MITATFNARLVDRMQKLAYSLPIQCPWWKFSAIGTRCVDNIKAIPRVALIGAEPQKGAQVRNRMLKSLAAKTLAGLVDKALKAALRTGARQDAGNRPQVVLDCIRSESAQINEMGSVLRNERVELARFSHRNEETSIA
ncbi:hypothetical protein AB3X91_40185 [Paraburkholderia sp. BR14263]|uniref:Uncharacterized protein n=3 Tax=Burkholderiaceae TaxID=119060 RepID=A0ABU9SNT1_9BURK